MAVPTIPEYIVVHLGDPASNARNIWVPFIDYIKNVASGEIYPTWPESALRANILAQITFALNRIYTEWYRSQGYDFDITNSTRYDQQFTEDREYFDSVVRIVDQIFNNYVVKQNSVEPYFTQYCDGRRVQCEGLSQWGTVPLAEQGRTPYEILQNYYGNDINIVNNAPVQPNVPTYPGVSLRLGSAGEDVRIIQRQLNRISDNYPAITKIPQTNGYFNVQTEAAVRKFQQVFNLTVDGIVGKATWYRIKNIYNGVKRLGELYSEGLSLEEVSRIFPEVLREGDRSQQVGLVQYYLAVVGYFDNDIPQIGIDNVFGPNTRAATIAFQAKYGLPPTGEMNRETFIQLTSAYDSIRSMLLRQGAPESEKIFPGRFLSRGMTGDDITLLQRYLSQIAGRDPSFPRVTVTGTFDVSTENAVETVQNRYNIVQNGAVGPLTWDRIVRLAEA